MRNASSRYPSKRKKSKTCKPNDVPAIESIRRMWFFGAGSMILLKPSFEGHAFGKPLEASAVRNSSDDLYGYSR
jgi:hypothetical protein